MELTQTDKSTRLLFCLYLNYFIHGIGLVILSQNMVHLATAWNAPLAAVSVVISGIGIGRLVSYVVTGVLADHLRRKVMVYGGMIAYLAFAVGMIVSTNIVVAYVFDVCAGIANSALDAGTYTTLAEVTNKGSAAMVILKAFMSLGEFILPLIVVNLSSHRQWFGWSFVVMASLIIVNMILLAPQKFPDWQNQTGVNHIRSNLKGRKKLIITVALGVFGYTSMAAMLWFTQWITIYGQQVLNLSSAAAHLLMSLYSIGSLVGVFISFILLQRSGVEKALMLGMNTGALFALLLLVNAHENIWLMQLASLLFGLAAASGVMQVGLALLMKVFPQARGRITGIYYFLGSIASLTVPLISATFTNSLSQLMLGNILICFVSVIVSIVVWVVGRDGLNG